MVPQMLLWGTVWKPAGEDCRDLQGENSTNLRVTVKFNFNEEACAFNKVVAVITPISLDRKPSYDFPIHHVCLQMICVSSDEWQGQPQNLNFEEWEVLWIFRPKNPDLFPFHIDKMYLFPLKLRSKMIDWVGNLRAKRCKDGLNKHDRHNSGIPVGSRPQCGGQHECRLHRGGPCWAREHGRGLFTAGLRLSRGRSAARLMPAWDPQGSLQIPLTS